MSTFPKAVPEGQLQKQRSGVLEPKNSFLTRKNSSTSMAPSVKHLPASQQSSSLNLNTGSSFGRKPSFNTAPRGMGKSKLSSSYVNLLSKNQYGSIADIEWNKDILNNVSTGLQRKVLSKSSNTSPNPPPNGSKQNVLPPPPNTDSPGADTRSVSKLFPTMDGGGKLLLLSVHFETMFRFHFQCTIFCSRLIICNNLSFSHHFPILPSFLSLRSQLFVWSGRGVGRWVWRGGDRLLCVFVCVFEDNLSVLTACLWTLFACVVCFGCMLGFMTKNSQT